MKLTKFECKACERVFYQEVVGKSIADASQIFLNTKCIQCGSSEKIVAHGGEYEVINP